LVHAQTAPQNTAEVITQDTPATFRTGVNLVMVPVVVRDRTGKAIGDLHKEDFQLFDKGKPQIVTRFSLEKPNIPTIVAIPASDPNVPSPAPTVPTPAIPEHFVAYVFDDVHLHAGDLERVRVAATAHLESLEEATRAAIFTTSGRTTLDFTDDREKLRATLNQIAPWQSAHAVASDCPSISYYQADLIVNQNDSQALGAATAEALACNPPPPNASAAQIQQAQQQAQALARAAAEQQLSVGDYETRLALSVLLDVVRRLAAMPGARNLVLVSAGFHLTIDHRVDESELMNRAARANVTISALDARGLYTLAPDASQPFQGTLKAQFQRDSALADEDVMAELADATGGAFFHHDNDLRAGLKQLAAQPEFVYVLGFAPQNLKLDGSFHALKVTVNRQGLTMQARRGYYAPKHVADPVEEAREEVRQAVFSREEIHDIPVDLNLQFFKSSERQAKLSVLARVDIRGLHYQKAADRNLDTLTVVAGVFDRNGNFISGIEKTVELRLRDETLGKLPASGIGLRSTFDLQPGAYVLRLVVRDSAGQSMAARNGAVQIP
jgi:VWFA-related protein